jgi:hypothetical protein
MFFGLSHSAFAQDSEVRIQVIYEVKDFASISSHAQKLTMNETNVKESSFITSIVFVMNYYIVSEKPQKIDNVNAHSENIHFLLESIGSGLLDKHFNTRVSYKYFLENLTHTDLFDTSATELGDLEYLQKRFRENTPVMMKFNQNIRILTHGSHWMIFYKYNVGNDELSFFNPMDGQTYSIMGKDLSPKNKMTPLIQGKAPYATITP